MPSEKKKLNNAARDDRWGRLRAIIALGRPTLATALVAGLIAQSGGCTRPFYRKKADEEVSEVLAQKDKYPEWQIDQWHVYPDPRARFADACDPDHPPKPPDDPASYAMSPNPQKPGKAGVARTEGTAYLELIARWDKENRERRARDEAEEKAKEEEPKKMEELAAGPVAIADPPDVTVAGPQDPIAEASEKSRLDITGRPTYLMTLDQAAELATFNSREYQDQRENLDLAALPVTLERFSFTTQFFAAQEAIRANAGSNTTGGPVNNWTLNNGTGFSKILPTGALLLLNFSNQTVFNFLNPKTTLSTTTLNFDAIQPLLHGGGEAVALESLTQAERNLLYQIRTFARFRKELYVEIASNSGGSINGAAFQPTGVLSTNGSSSGGLGASGLTPGVIAPIALTRSTPIQSPSSPGNLSLSPAITPAPSGYLNTMLEKIQVYIDQENIDTLSGILLRYRGLLEGDVVGPLQVQSVEQQLLTGRATLLNDQQDYLEALDTFKIEIGVPMQLSIEMDDTLMRPLMKQFRRSRAIIENEQAAVSTASGLIDIDKAPFVRAELLRLFEQSALVRGTKFAGTIRGRWNEWERLSTQELNDRLAALTKESQKLLDIQADKQKLKQHLSPADQARLKEVIRLIDLGNFERALRLYELAYVDNGKPKKPAPAEERQRIRQFQTVVSLWQRIMVEPRDDQWDAIRATWPELPRCCVDGVDLVNSDLTQAQATGARHALENRLDLMNVRSQVVDAWRQIAVYANALLGTFTAQYHFSASSPTNVAQPFNLGSGSNEMILDTDLPLVRIEERNNYRASLIAYQRQRRALQEAEDLTVQAVYSELYLLRQYAETYKVQKRQLELAYLTIDSSLESLEAPTSTNPSKAGQDGPAALTQQLLTAQRSLPTAQNALLTVWINYLDARLQLYRDLELMPLDARGVWIDEIRDCDCGIGGAPGCCPTPAQTAEPIQPPKELPPVVEGAIPAKPGSSVWK
jgi:hypothetical protein